jgi:hypothetical protein
MNYYWFALFAICLYFVVTDQSVAKFVYYIGRLVKFEYEKIKWWTFHNPANPIVKYLMWRRALKLAKEIEKSLNK